MIAIENVRLFDEVQARTRDLQLRTEDLSESLQRQTATADVLKVISRSTFDLQTVLQTLVEFAARLCEADLANIWRPRGTTAFHLVASFGVPGKDKERLENKEYLESVDLAPGRGSIVGRVLLERRTVQVHDVQADPEYELSEVIRIGDYRTALGVPLLREGAPIGVIFLTRCTVQAFTDKQIELVQTFADQAVIAIENVRLFDEVQAKTRDLSEALTYQTGSSNILSVIASSPTDVRPVLRAIVESACELCGAYDAILRLKVGDNLEPGAHHGPIPAGSDKWPINRNWTAGRAVIDKEPVHVHDMQSAEGNEFPESQKRARDQGHRTILSIPMLREDESIGVIVLRRQEVHPFSDRQIALLKTFADQAVIAIGNVRLFEEVQAKTRDLTESLEQQTATSEVLEVISSTPGDLEPVFDKMLENATRVCGANFGTMNLVEDGVITRVASYNVPSAYADASDTRSFRPHPKSSLGQVIANKEAHQILDLLDSPAYLDGDPAVISIVRNAGARSLVSVPMLRDTELIGTISVYGQEVRPFSGKQIELLSNFAKQAVIAIENTRLLKELRESLQQQTATADVLKVISRSTFDLQTVLQTLVESAARLCDADKSQITRQKNGGFYRAEAYGFSAVFMDYVSKYPDQARTWLWVRTRAARKASGAYTGRQGRSGV